MGAEGMTRRDDWVRRLDAVFASAASRPFAWGAHDCFTFAGEAVEAMTGKAIAFPRDYADGKGARRVLRRLGFRSYAAAVTAHLGPEKPVGFARRGDVVLAEIDGAESLCVVDLTGEAVLGPGPDGLIRLPLSAVRTAWSVG